MKITLPHDVPLHLYIPVAKVFYPFPIYFLRLAAPVPYEKSISRILNSLNENSYSSIDKVQNATIGELRQVRNFGEKGLAILLELLHTLSRQPELVLETEKLDHSLRAELDHLKQVMPVKLQLLDIGIEV
ncbi:hypothetical protein [Paenibacillus riograndensis]|uniref:RNA polymerase alpha subunit C-terminal domain-containing protein n=1 Tax=Paenibacillus riograndensis SBR5 TaxID=1073571 RepID=A0A0E3WIR4_9BACL|nr:hypothetical protein [Paenibacillus riograndensis]CQR57493.1 hypothetical protein PRIO_5092 [Paenibacillus riograndensis SBR5]